MLDVVIQVASISVCFSTFRTNKRPKVCVSQSVCFQVAGLIELFSTLIAGVPLVTNMATFVQSQTLMRVEALLADVTFVRSVVEVFCVTMIVEICECCK